MCGGKENQDPGGAAGGRGRGVIAHYCWVAGGGVQCCGGVALAVGGVSRRVSAFKGDNSCWGAVALSAGLSCGGWGERGLVGCVQS